MKKVLFIDRDGTLIIEPPVDFQVDSLEKLEFFPAVFRNLYYIKTYLDFELVIVSNQDGLGTPSFPEETYIPVQQKMITAFKNEGVEFNDVVIDKTFPEEKAPTRKPGTTLLTKYMTGEYDLANSYVIGDRLTDIQLAKNLGAKGILITSINKSDELKQQNLTDVCVLLTDNWTTIFEFLKLSERTATITRKTKETDITITLNLDGTGKTEISTGLNFFDHMLDQIGRHSGMDLKITTKGDLQVDEHHTIEDTAIALGDAIYQAIGNKRGIERYGYTLPMDDCMAQVLLDFGGRSWLEWNAEFKREKVGDVPTEMFYHFFKSFADAAKCNLNIKAEGDNEHHKIEGVFKAFAKAIKMAIKRDAFNYELPSTKGIL